MANIDILTGLNITGQFPLNVKIHFKTINDLIDLGLNEINAFKYHQSMVVVCYENNKQYIWREPETIGELGEIPTDFNYPLNTVSDGVDYSGKSYNFFPYNNVILTDVFPNNVVLVGDYYHTGDYNFTMWASRYIINGNEYTDYISANATVAPAHPTLNRIDTMVITDDNLFVVRAGTANLSPTPPPVDLGVEVAFFHIFVSAGTTVSTVITTEIVYEENLGEPIEWTVTDILEATPGNIIANAPNGNASSTCIKFTNAAKDDLIRIDNDVTIEITDSTKILFDVIFDDITIEPKIRLAVVGEGYGTSKTATLPGYGLDLTNTFSWQTCTIPMNIGFTFQPAFDRISISNDAISNGSFRIDNIRIQKGGTSVISGTHPIYLLEETASTISLTKDGLVVSTVIKGGASNVTIFGNRFSYRKGINNIDNNVIEVDDIAIQGYLDANTFILYMVYTNAVADNDKDNPLNWDIIQTL